MLPAAEQLLALRRAHPRLEDSLGAPEALQVREALEEPRGQAGEIRCAECRGLDIRGADNWPAARWKCLV